MKNLKVVFMGTPDFSINILNELILSTNVIAVVTQPDKDIIRSGKKQIKQSPIKKIATEHSIKVFQPEKIKENYQPILNLNPDIIITCAYGQFLPKELLNYPKYGCINVHASLLPKLRGGAPIHKAIIEGHSETGITIMYMGEKMDNGDIISQKKIKIEENDNVGTLYNKLSLLGTELLKETLPTILNGTYTKISQDEKEATFAYNIQRKDELLDFNKTKKEVLNQIRGLNPFPVAYTNLDNKELKVYEAIVGENILNDKQNGEIIKIYKDGIGVKVSDGEIILKRIKPSGKKEMNSRDFLNGLKDKNSLIGKILK